MIRSALYSYPNNIIAIAKAQPLAILSLSVSSEKFFNSSMASIFPDPA